jgi:hypothetical protein
MLASKNVDEDKDFKVGTNELKLATDTARFFNCFLLFSPSTKRTKEAEILPLQMVGTVCVL